MPARRYRKPCPEFARTYDGWCMPCRINVFSGRKRERSPRENPPKGDFVGFSHGDLSPRQAMIRQTVAENATHGMSRTFVWWGERLPCENTTKSPFGGFSRGAFSPFRPENTIIRHGTNQHVHVCARMLIYSAVELQTTVCLAMFLTSTETTVHVHHFLYVALSINWFNQSIQSIMTWKLQVNKLNGWHYVLTNESEGFFKIFACISSLIRSV